MPDKKEAEEGPLSSEALKRDEWRGEERRLKPKDAPGHTLPESEQDLHDLGERAEGPNPMAGTMLPPD